MIVYDFPTLAVQSQLFYAAGSSFDGGYTAGGATLMSPEPGGRAYLELSLSLQVNEWTSPVLSWLMSKCTNGSVFRVPLTRTPQLLSVVSLGIDQYTAEYWHDEGVYPDNGWDNGQPWELDGFDYPIVSIALEGGTSVVIDTSVLGNVLTYGHVIGIGNYAYMIDNIEYNDDANTATITVNPPLRDGSNDSVVTRPYFTGMITNGAEFRTNYEAANIGNIQPSRLLFSEVIV